MQIVSPRALGLCATQNLLYQRTFCIKHMPSPCCSARSCATMQEWSLCCSSRAPRPPCASQCSCAPPIHKLHANNFNFMSEMTLYPGRRLRASCSTFTAWFHSLFIAIVRVSSACRSVVPPPLRSVQQELFPPFHSVHQRLTKGTKIIRWSRPQTWYTCKDSGECAVESHQDSSFLNFPPIFKRECCQPHALTMAAVLKHLPTQPTSCFRRDAYKRPGLCRRKFVSGRRTQGSPIPLALGFYWTRGWMANLFGRQEGIDHPCKVASTKDVLRRL